MYDLVIDKSFDLKKTNNYILSIQVSLGGFSFSVVQPQNNQLLVLKHTPLKISKEQFLTRRLKEWINSEEILQKNYRNCRLIVFTEKFTLLPEHLFFEEKSREIMQLFYELNADENVKVNRIE